MRSLILFACLLTGPLHAQTAAPVTAPDTASIQSSLSEAVSGRWTGVLEYRDYSEPATSTKRVQLPTWLTIAPAGASLSLDFIYDDGPSKTVTEHSTVLLDATARTYTVTSFDSKQQVFSVTGFDQLKSGRGTLVLTGPGTDNKLPAEIRTTWTVRRNLLSWLEEVRPAGSSDPFTFRHRYTFTRADPPSAAPQGR